MATVTKSSVSSSDVGSKISQVVGGVVIFIGSIIYRGLVLSVLWGWYVVVVFHTPFLTIPQALGLSLLSSMIGNASVKAQAQKVIFKNPANGSEMNAEITPIPTKFIETAGGTFGWLTVILALGWIYHFFL